MCSPSDGPAASLEGLEEEITTLAGHLNAATCRWLLLVGEYDRREGWAPWGCRSCAQWLSWRCAIGAGTAREQVRVARSLDDLPLIRAAFAEGRLSYSQARALTRVATPELEKDLLELARHATGGQLERLVRGYRGAAAQLDGANRAYAGRYLLYHQDDDGSLVLEARLPAEEGELVLAALRAAGEEIERRPRAEASSDVPGDVSAETPSPPSDPQPTSRDRDESVSAETSSPAAGTRRRARRPCRDRPRARSIAAGGRRSPAGPAPRRPRDPPGRRPRALRGRGGRAARAGDRATPRLRRERRSGPHPRRSPARRRPAHAKRPVAHPPRLDRARRRLPLPRLRPAAIRRCPPHRPLGSGGRDQPLQSRAPLPPPPPAARGRLHRPPTRRRLAFHRPDGRRIPDHHLVRRGDVDHVPRASRRRGLPIDAETTVPRWAGDPLDVGLATELLLWRAGHRPGAEAADADAA